MKKRGLSTVISTLLLIGLSLTAVVIIWAVVSNILSKSSEEISLGKFTVNVEIEKVLSKGDNIEVTVKRNPGSGEITGLYFVVSDGNSSKVFQEKDVEIKELEEKTLTIDYDGIVKSISVSPMFGEGSESLGKTAKIDFSNEEIMQNLGAVSWWRFNGNANDEIGINDCIVNGATITSGKYNQAYKFDGINDYINCSNDSSLNIVNEITIVTWIYLFPDDNSDNPVVSKNNQNIWPTSYGYALGSGYTLDARFGLAGGETTATISGHNQWVNLAGTYDKNNMVLYINGDQSNSVSNTNPIGGTIQDLWIGHSVRNDQFYNGTIDEVMIFNRALTQAEIQGIYNLDLS